MSRARTHRLRAAPKILGSVRFASIRCFRLRVLSFSLLSAPGAPRSLALSNTTCLCSLAQVQGHRHVDATDGRRRQRASAASRGTDRRRRRVASVFVSLEEGRVVGFSHNNGFFSQKVEWIDDASQSSRFAYCYCRMLLSFFRACVDDTSSNPCRPQNDLAPNNKANKRAARTQFISLTDLSEIP